MFEIERTLFAENRLNRIAWCLGFMLFALRIDLIRFISEIEQKKLLEKHDRESFDKQSEFT